MIADARNRAALVYAAADACLDDFARDVRLQIRSEFSEKFGRSRSGIALQRAIDNGLRQRRIEIPRGALGNEDKRGRAGEQLGIGDGRARLGK